MADRADRYRALIQAGHVLTARILDDTREVDAISRTDRSDALRAMNVRIDRIREDATALARISDALRDSGD